MIRQILALWMLLMAFGLTAEAVIVPSEYRNGPEICRDPRYATSSELGQWIEVPVDDTNPNQGTTPLYFWTHKVFDPNKKTVIFVSGGPGETAHESRLDLKNWNVVFFDQRGNTCSKPKSRNLFLDPGFYSSKRTAFDIEEIRKKLKVDRVSVYGISYGTVPAHLYGYFFPESTRTVLLEGVIFKGGIDLIQPARQRKLLQKFFDALPMETQNRILTLSNHPQISANWFSLAGQMMLYLDHFEEAFKTFLDHTIWEENIAIQALGSFNKHEPTESEYGSSHVLMGMIGCQELGMDQAETGASFIFQNDQLVADSKNHFRENYCRSLGFADDESLQKLYEATGFPSNVPVIYLQGVNDGATVATQAIRHYEEVAKGPAQLILVRDGGHLPMAGPLISGFAPAEELDSRSHLLEIVLEGQTLQSSDLEAISKATRLRWKMTHKKPQP